jgi:hypothetical protein
MIATNIKLEGVYTLDNDLLKAGQQTLKLGLRHRPKKGQARRFIGLIDYSKPEQDQFSYISSLYAIQGQKNCYEFEYGGQYYSLRVTGINRVEIAQTVKEPVLVYEGAK